MRHLYIAVLSLALAGATAAFSQVTLNPTPSRAIGQPQLIPTSSNPNLVEGRELYSPQGVALDTLVSPPMVYVSDYGNNRVLAWKNAASFSNGKPADLVIGQRDRFTTFPQGPGVTGSTLSTGLSSPTGLAVRNGDLYVADSGNNRVLRYPTPFQHADTLFPDLYIGQPSLNSRAANYTGQISEKGIFLAGNNAVYQANMAFDTAGNLWLTDPGNRRVLRFSAADLKNGGGGLAANLELGQLDFVSAQPVLITTDASSRLKANQFAVPAGIAFDSAGRLYVSDSDPGGQFPIHRVLVFTPPFSSNQLAARIMGIVTPPPVGAPALTASQMGQIAMYSPSGMFFLPANQGMGVVDTGYSRILIFDPYDQWPDTSTAISPSAKAVVGQGNDFAKIGPNNGSAKSSETTMFFPSAAVFSGNELYLADAADNRVIVMPLQSGTFGSATRVLGQDRFDTNSINLIEGREFQFIAQSGGGLFADAALAIDSTGDTPHLYVSDPYNNRVLGFKDMRKLKPGDRADIVLGQPDMQTALCNYPAGDVNQPTQSSLCRPMGLLVDSSGNLYVADGGNGRVLRFPTPFAHYPNVQADLVLGQQNFTTKITDPTSRTMAFPYGLALAGNNGLLVSDQTHHRVLFFTFTGNGTFTAGTDNGLAAAKVFGQPDFTTIVKGTDDAGMNAPHHLAADTDGRPYVVDSGNNRVLIFDQIMNLPSAGARAAVTIPSLNSPRGIYVSPLTGEIWVADFGNARCLRYPRFQAYLLNGAPTASIGAYGGTLAVAQDQYGGLLVADTGNRVEFYYPSLVAINAANFLVNRALGPGMAASIYPLGGQFGTDTANFNELPNPLPLPKTLADVQVLFNGNPAPLYYVSPGQINFYVPMGAPTTGTADLQVVRQSSGQILADGLVAMNVASPGVFLNPQGQTGPLRQAAVYNQDGTVNSPTSPAPRGSTIAIYATGQGFVPGAPDDGQPAQGLTRTPTRPTVFIGTSGCNLDDASCTNEPTIDHIPYSGLAPTLVGVWQINVVIPQIVPPNNNQTWLTITMNSISATDFTQYRTTIAVGK